MTTVYISDSEIRVICGSGSGTPRVNAALPPIPISDCTFGGVIARKDEIIHRLRAALDDAAAKNIKLDRRSVTLSVNSSKFVTRRLGVPAMSRDATREFILNDFADVEGKDGYLLVWSVIPGHRDGRIRQVCAALIAPEAIAPYIDICVGCGLKVASAEPAIFSLIRVLGNSVKPGTTDAFLLADTNGFTCAFIENGSYVYSYYIRMSADATPEEWAGETVSCISRLIQSIKAQRLGSFINEIILGGFGTGERADAVSSALSGVEEGVNIVSFPDVTHGHKPSDEFDTGGEAFAVGALMHRADRGQTDLCAGLRSARTGRKTPSREIIVSIAVIMATILICGGISAFCLVDKAGLTSKLDIIAASLAEPELSGKVEEYDRAIAEQLKLCEKIKGVDALSEVIASYPIPDSSVVAELERCAAGYASVEVLSYNGATGSLSINAISANVGNINEFIEIIRAHDAFVITEYSGYEYNESSVGDGNWSIKLSLRLSHPVQSTGNAGSTGEGNGEADR